jgi:hypothetical protein
MEKPMSAIIVGKSFPQLPGADADTDEKSVQALEPAVSPSLLVWPRLASE